MCLTFFSSPGFDFKYPTKGVFLVSTSTAPELCQSQRILFCGPPGTGKTMLARAIAKESGVAFMCVTLAQTEDKYFGETPKILRALFEVAKERAPCIVFFDEIDGLMRTRRDDDQGCVYGAKTEFLQLCDRIKPSDSVVLIACTNNETSLDPALRRRFPSVYRIPLPQKEDRADILRRITRNESQRLAAADVEHLAVATEGMSGSGLQDAYGAACTHRLRRTLHTVSLSSKDTAQEFRRQLLPMTIEDWVGGLATRAAAATTPSKTAQDVGSDEGSDEELPPDG